MVGFVGRIVAFAAFGIAAAAGSHADTPADSRAITAAAAPAIGGLSLAPERWRYRPALPLATIASTPTAMPPANRRHRAAPTLRSLDDDYVADRASFINSVKARRGLSLLTLWEGAGRCLFFGINDRGRAGINFVRMRSLRDTSTAENPLYETYAELTGQTRPTFPEPPRLFPH